MGSKERSAYVLQNNVMIAEGIMEDEDRLYPGNRLRVVTEEDRDQADMRRCRATRLLSEGHYDAALALYSEAIELNPASSLLLVKRGQVFLKLEKPYPCIEDCTRALDIDCDSAAAYKFRGKAFMFLGRWAEAARDLRTSCKIDFDAQASECLQEVNLRIKEQQVLNNMKLPNSENHCTFNAIRYKERGEYKILKLNYRKDVEKRYAREVDDCGVNNDERIDTRVHNIFNPKIMDQLQKLYYDKEQNRTTQDDAQYGTEIDQNVIQLDDSFSGAHIVDQCNNEGDPDTDADLDTSDLLNTADSNGIFTNLDYSSDINIESGCVRIEPISMLPSQYYQLDSELPGAICSLPRNSSDFSNLQPIDFQFPITFSEIEYEDHTTVDEDGRTCPRTSTSKDNCEGPIRSTIHFESDPEDDIISY